MGAGSRFDQLGGDAYALPSLAHTTLEDIADSKIAADFLQVDGFPFVSKCRIAGDHKEPSPLRQCRDDVLSNAVNEIILFGIVAHIVKRQDGDRRPFGQCQRPRGLLRLTRAPAPHPNRLRDVLDGVLAGELEACAYLPSYL